MFIYCTKTRAPNKDLLSLYIEPSQKAGKWKKKQFNHLHIKNKVQNN